MNFDIIFFFFFGDIFEQNLWDYSFCDIFEKYYVFIFYCCFVINFVLNLIIRIRIGLSMDRMIISVLIYMNYILVVSRIFINVIDLILWMMGILILIFQI